MFGLWKSKWQKKYEALAAKTWDYEACINGNEQLIAAKNMLQASLDLAQGQLQKSHYRVTELEAELKQLKEQAPVMVTLCEAPEPMPNPVREALNHFNNKMLGTAQEPKVHNKNDFKKSKKHHPRNGAHHNNP